MKQLKFIKKIYKKCFVFRWSAVNCCGTNFTVRADALKDVGYFPVGCLTEDTLLSLRLCTMGWGVAYHHEVLAVGQSPHELTEIFKQRSRLVTIIFIFFTKIVCSAFLVTKKNC